MAYIVPIIFSEIDAWRSALNASTVDKDMDLAHYIKCPLKDFFHSLEVCKVTIDDLDFYLESPNCIECCQVGTDTTGRFSLDKTDGSPRFC